jgi:hypothetical protein
MKVCLSFHLLAYCSLEELPPDYPAFETSRPLEARLVWGTTRCLEMSGLTLSKDL